jgi:hypothetical protein
MLFNLRRFCKIKIYKNNISFCTKLYILRVSKLLNLIKTYDVFANNKKSFFTILNSKKKVLAISRGPVAKKKKSYVYSGFLSSYLKVYSFSDSPINYLFMFLTACTLKSMRLSVKFISFAI